MGLIRFIAKALVAPVGIPLLAVKEKKRIKARRKKLRAKSITHKKRRKRVL